MEIVTVDFTQWRRFYNEFPYQDMSKFQQCFNIDCIDHCNPNMHHFPVFGVVENGELLGMLSYTDKYIVTKETVHNGVSHVRKGMASEKIEGSFSVAYIYSIVVHPAARNKGVATKLIQHLESITPQDYLMMYPVSTECEKLGKKIGFDFHNEIFIQLEDVVKKVEREC